MALISTYTCFLKETCCPSELFEYDDFCLGQVPSSPITPNSSELSTSQLVQPSLPTAKERRAERRKILDTQRLEALWKTINQSPHVESPHADPLASKIALRRHKNKISAANSRRNKALEKAQFDKTFSTNVDVILELTKKIDTLSTQLSYQNRLLGESTAVDMPGLQNSMYDAGEICKVLSRPFINWQKNTMKQINLSYSEKFIFQKAVMANLNTLIEKLEQVFDQQHRILEGYLHLTL